jgi:RHS repeat-associated protein
MVLLATQPARADVGSISASYQVDPDGGFDYTIPISLPAGPNGVTPNLSLIYNSSSSYNAGGIVIPLAGTSNPDSIPAGAGWVLEGLSTIQRTDATEAENGGAANYEYAAGDPYALDGSQLRLTSQNDYGEDGSTYQTEMANFSLVTAHGTSGSGPEYWTAQLKNGLTYEYGNTTSSQILSPSGSGKTREWLLDKVSDANGNSYTVTYGLGASGSSGIGVPTQISWTPSASGSSSYNYTVSLTYTPRGSQEPISGFDPSGYQLENNNLLSSITVASGATTVRYYKLSYSSSTTGRSLLSSVQECTNSSMSNCFPATTFAYGSGQPGVSSSGLTAVSGATQIIGAYDFTGDGLSDLLYLQGSTLYTAFSNGSTLNAGVSTGITPVSWVIGKVVGNGQYDILTSKNGIWWLYSWNGSAFTGTSLGISYCLVCTYELADVNGDGRPDLVQLQFSSSSIQVSVALNTSSNGVPSFGPMAAWGASIPIPQYGTGQVLNAWFATPQAYFQSFDGIKLAGNGADDLMIAWQTVLSEGGSNGYLMVIDELVPSGGSFKVQQISEATSLANAPPPQMFYGYFNRDAGPVQCTDFVQGGAAASGAYYSACDGNGLGGASNSGTAVGAVDWNGDGLTDLLMSNGNTLGVQTSTGTGFSSMITTTIPLTTGETAMPLSVTGNASAPDIGIISGSTFTYYLHNTVDDPADTMTSLTDGNGNTTKIAYSSITGTGNAYTPGTGANMTVEEVADTDTLFVVQTLTLPDGLGGTYTKTYHYTDGRINYARAPSFEGFAKVKTTDSRIGEVETTSYDQLFPLTGMMTEDDLSQSAGTPISTSTYTNVDDELVSTQYDDQHFPYASEVETKAYEVGGVENGAEVTDTVTESKNPDAYGNFDDIDITITAGSASPYSGQTWTTNTTASYVDDASTWCLTLPSSVAVANAAPSEATITHTNTYARNGTWCRPSQVVEDAGNSSYDVTRAFQYDAFGNVSKMTVSGTGVSPARVWNYNWGPTGQFQVDIQDPVGTAQNYEEAIGYNYGLGLKASDVIQTLGGVHNTPPNTWTYDGLGELTQEGFPDGTTLNWTYSACSQTSCNDYPDSFEVVAETAKQSNGTQISSQSTYLDSFGRTVAATKLLMDGTEALTERQYDQFGNVVKQSTPCNGSSCPGYWTETTYDALNRPTGILSPDPQNPSTQDTTQINYAGGKTTVTNADNETSLNVTDVTGAMRETTDANGFGQTFALDSDGNVLQASSSQGTITQSYYYGGEGDYSVSRIDPALGSWSYSPDALGEVLSYQDAKGQQFKMVYDGSGRLTQRSDGWAASGSETVTSWTWGVTPSSHDVGQLDEAQTTTTDGTYVDQRAYDGDSRLSTRAITIPGDAEYTYSYTYNAQGLLGTLQYPAGGAYSGPELSYAYTNGVLTSVTDANAGTVYWKANAINGLGQVTEDTLGNGIVTERTFVPTSGLLTKAISGPSAGSATVQNQSYLYDPLGNLIQRQQTNASAALTENFSYDADNRVTASQLVNGSTTTTNLEVSYNPGGSIASKMETGGTDTPVAYTPQWTSYNYPRSISATLSTGQTEGATFDYGPDRQRWRMVYTEGSASETTEYIGGLMEKVISSVGNQYRYYVKGTDELAAIVDSNGSGVTSVDYVLEDQERSIAALLNSTGTIAVNESFTAYGNRREASTWVGPPTTTEEGVMDGITRQGFTGQTVLGQMGLNHMKGRVEDAVTGTFLSPDPRVNDPYNTQDYNRYTYVYNNPLTNIDPSGFDCLTVAPGGTMTVTLPDGTEIGGYSAPDLECSPDIPSPQVNIVIADSGGGGTPAAQQTQQQQTNPPIQSKVCQYASSNPDASELAAVATTLGIDDNLVQAIEKADPAFSLPGLLGEAAPTVLSGAATGIAGGIIAGKVRQGEYLNATLDSMDMGLGLVSAKAGGSLLLADTAFNALGGFKQLAKGAANVICTVTGGK